MEYWHILNRGVDKRKVFNDEKDYLRFIRSMYFFNERRYIDSTTRRNNITGKTELSRNRKIIVKIHAYCLMPNHYHLLLSAVDNDFSNISLFMKKLNKGYAQAFNNRHKRTGALWQGKYKKVLIKHDPHFQYIPYYIHYNPLDLFAPEWRNGSIKNIKDVIDFLDSYRWSSYLDYKKVRNFPSILHKLENVSISNNHSSFRKILNNKDMVELTHLPFLE